MARLLVGLPALRGDLGKYTSRFDLVELRPVDTSLPRLKTLRKWRASAPPSFAFSVVLPHLVSELAPGKGLAVVERAIGNRRHRVQVQQLQPDHAQVHTVDGPVLKTGGAQGAAVADALAQDAKGVRQLGAVVPCDARHRSEVTGLLLTETQRRERSP